MSFEDIRPRGLLFSEYDHTKNKNVVQETIKDKHGDGHDRKR